MALCRGCVASALCRTSALLASSALSAPSAPCKPSTAPLIQAPPSRWLSRGATGIPVLRGYFLRQEDSPYKQPVQTGHPGSSLCSASAGDPIHHHTLNPQPPQPPSLLGVCGAGEDTGGAHLGNQTSLPSTPFRPPRLGLPSPAHSAPCPLKAVNKR